MSTKQERENGAHARECRVRRALAKLGFKLRRNTTRRKTDECHGRYRIIDGEGHSVFRGDPRKFNLSLDTAEAWARHTPRAARSTGERQAA